MNDKKISSKEKAILCCLFHPECNNLQDFLGYIDESDSFKGTSLLKAMEHILKLAQKDYVIFDWPNNCILIRYMDKEKEMSIVQS